MKDRFDMFRITSGMDMALGRSGGLLMLVM